MKTDKPLIKGNKSKLTRIFFLIWLLTIVIAIFFALIGNFIQNDFINYIFGADILIGIFAFFGMFISIFLNFIAKRLNINLNKPIIIDKWYMFAIITVIIFACLFYFKITKDSEIKLKEETPTVMDCLKLGSDDARISCIKYYHPKK